MKTIHRHANRAIVPLLLALAFQAWPLESRGQAPQVFCGMGPPPGSPGFAEHERQQDQQRAALGHVLVCEQNLRRFAFAEQARPLEQFSSRLAFQPVELEDTLLSTFKLLGGISEIESGEGIVALLRVFRTSSGLVIGLREWDMSSGGRIRSSRADLHTERVHESPAQLLVYQSPSGPAVSMLSWVEGRRFYELTVDANVRQVTLSPSLIQLAESLPKSIPARFKAPSLPVPDFSMGPPPVFPSQPPSSK